VIVVATGDFELYHDLVAELRARSAEFTTRSPGDDLPPETRVVLTGADDPAPDAERVVAAPDEAEAAVERALAALRDGDGRTVVGVDPGERPGVAVLRGETVVAACQVPVDDAEGRVRDAVADAPDPLVRVGDGARRWSARLVESLGDLPVELVDETGTTPSLGAGARGMGDVLAAVNIARTPGEAVDGRDIEPSAGEIGRVKAESRRRSDGAVTIDEALARRVALGEVTLDEALAEHGD
jgi:Tfp pilus assembly protein PilX